ncbi:MAG: D-alanyl-D-alanine carboxypeptidase family protein [Acetatifactor sp.]
MKHLNLLLRLIIGGLFCAVFWGVLYEDRRLCTVSARALSGVISEEGDTHTPPEELTLYATAAVLMDADSGRVLYGKKENIPMAMASTTKVLTCIVVLENTMPEEELTVSAYAASMPKVKLYIQKGEKYTVGDLLYSLMLESHNDSAVALAEYVGKNYLEKELAEKPTEQYTPEESRKAVSAFARLMNEKAVELGCENSWFITPNGLDATQEFTLPDGTVLQKEHCTTAKELAQILSYCIGKSPKSKEFLEITRAGNHCFTANGRSFSCVNHNAFLSMMEGALSGKTGFTNKAGYCYVGSLKRDGRTFVVALLACGWPGNKGYKWSDTRKLMQYGIDHYFYRDFLEEENAFDERLLEPVPVKNGRVGLLGSTAYTDIALEEGLLKGNTERKCDGVLMRQEEKVAVSYSWKKELIAPVTGGMEIGRVTYSVDGRVYRTEKIVTTEEVDAIDFSWCLTEIMDRFLGSNGE